MTAVVPALDQMVETRIVDAADIARALQTSVRSVSRWQAAGSAPRRDSEERLLELGAVVRLLTEVMQPEAARLWLRAPHPGLDYEKPLDLIAAGRYREVVAELLALAEGVTG